MLIEKKYSPIFHRQRQNFLQCRVCVCLITRPGKLEVGKHCRGRAYMKSGVQGGGAGRNWGGLGVAGRNLEWQEGAGDRTIAAMPSLLYSSHFLVG